MRDWSERLDGWAPDSFLVGAAEVTAAEAALARRPEGAHRVRAGAGARLRRAPAGDDPRPRRRDPAGRAARSPAPAVDAVGAYVPGGRYPMVASAFMTIVVPTGRRGGAGRGVRAAARRAWASTRPRCIAIASSGADQIVCLGGVQALAALAFGLGGIEPVDMLVGAGNAYVAEAKRQLFGRVGIDLLAGPTEILVLADADADAELVAADLLGQAEHGPTSPAVLVTHVARAGRRGPPSGGAAARATGRRARWPARPGGATARSS